MVEGGRSTAHRGHNIFKSIIQKQISAEFKKEKETEEQKQKKVNDFGNQ
jgi:hypothetical protein